MSDQAITGRPGGGSTSRSPNPSGGRKRDAAFYEALDRADGLPDLPPGTNRFTATRLLTNRGFARTQGWRPTLVAQLHFYIGNTKPLDWLPGNLRIAWPSVEDTADALGIDEDTVRTNDRKLMLLGAIAFQDSANYKRYGIRELDDSGRPTGPIVAACGIDVAPVALLLPDLQRNAAAYQAAKKKHKTLRRRLSAALRHSRTALDDAERDRLFAPAELEPLRSALADIEPFQRPDRLSLDELSRTCETADQFHDELAARIRAASAPVSSPNIPAMAPAGPVPQLHTKKNSAENLVAAALSPEASPEPPKRAAARPGPEGGNGSGADTSYHPDDIKGPAGEQVLEALSPRIARYLPPDREPSMTEFVEAASRARRDLKIGPELWNKACRRMSPEGASLALAHVAAKWDAGEIKKTPGAYFSGVFMSAIAGELGLGASLWGMVKAQPPGPSESVPLAAAHSPGSPSFPERGNEETRHEQHNASPTARKPVSALPSLFPDDPTPASRRVIAGSVVMRRFCSHMPDPERDGLMAVWKDLVQRHRRWPYLDEVQARYSAIHFSGTSPPLPSIPLRRPGNTT